MLAMKVDALRVRESSGSANYSGNNLYSAYISFHEISAVYAYIYMCVCVSSIYIYMYVYVCLSAMMNEPHKDKYCHIAEAFYIANIHICSKIRKHKNKAS